MALDLLVPDLLFPPDSPPTLRGLRLAALERWLARADRERRPERTATELLARAFALPSPPPVAAVTLAADAMPREGHWLRADPVHLRIDQDALRVHHAGVLDVSVEESRELTQALQGLFAADGLEFLAATPERWYVRVPQAEVPRTVALDEVLGRNVFGLLPSGEGRIRWASALTEAQMLLAAHEVNVRREARGALAINSVWFWGEGATPASLPAPYARILADDPLALGLARLSGIAAGGAPQNVVHVESAPGSRPVLAVLDALTASLRREDETAWREAAAGLEAGWFASLDGAIERFGTVRLLLPTGRDTLVATLGRTARWRWLRRSRPLASHA